MSRHSRTVGAKEAPGYRWEITITAALVLITLGLLLVRPKSNSHESEESSGSADTPAVAASGTSSEIRSERSHRISRPATQPTAGEIVANKLAQFGRSRREIVRAIARRSNRDVPAEVERFFDALETGRWEEIDAAFSAMATRSGQYEGSTHSPELDEFWPAVLDAYGPAEQAHLWPAQKLLDYGQAVLGSLKPGMVYVGGTDEGRFIPTFLNDTSDGEHHVVLTQNALADGRYLDYVNFLYGDRFAALTKGDSERAFQDYISDAQKRLLHDQQFPDEPKQLRPGEDVRMIDGKVQVSGQVAVMSINENLLRSLMENNPDLTFALQESFPFGTLYKDAAPLGPIMELGVQDQQGAMTHESAAQSLGYWRTTAQQLLSDPQASGSKETLASFSHLAVGQANLFAGHNYVSEAEEAYRLATQLSPGHSDATFGLAKLFAGSGRTDEALQLLNNFAANYPDKAAAVKNFRGSLNIGIQP